MASKKYGLFIWSFLFCWACAAGTPPCPPSTTHAGVKKVVILMGAPGSGKGTQARFLQEKFGYSVIGMGDLLRKEVSKKTEIGVHVQKEMNAGRFPPDALVIQVLEKHLETARSPILLDGFPRSLAQAKFLDTLLQKKGFSLVGVLMLKTSQETVVRRLSARYQCKECKALYAKGLSDTRAEGVCDSCEGTVFFIRPDDKPEVIRERLTHYKQRENSLLNHYKNKSLVFIFDGDQPASQVSNAIAQQKRLGHF